jgi:hypothetical protein
MKVFVFRFEILNFETRFGTFFVLEQGSTPASGAMLFRNCAIFFSSFFFHGICVDFSLTRNKTKKT